MAHMRNNNNISLDLPYNISLDNLGKLLRYSSNNNFSFEKFAEKERKEKERARILKMAASVVQNRQLTVDQLRQNRQRSRHNRVMLYLLDGQCKSSPDFIELIRTCIFKSFPKKLNLYIQKFPKEEEHGWLEIFRQPYDYWQDQPGVIGDIEIQPDALKKMYFVFLRCRPPKKWIDAAIKSIVPDILLLLSIIKDDRVRELFATRAYDQQDRSTRITDNIYKQIEKNAQLLMNVTYVLIGAAEFSLRMWKKSLGEPYFLRDFTNVFFKEMEREKNVQKVLYNVDNTQRERMRTLLLYKSNNNSTSNGGYFSGYEGVETWSNILNSNWNNNERTRQISEWERQFRRDRREVRRESRYDSFSNYQFGEDEKRFLPIIHRMQRRLYQRLQHHVAEYIKTEVPGRAASLIKKAWLHHQYKPGGSYAKRAITRVQKRAREMDAKRAITRVQKRAMTNRNTTTTRAVRRRTT
jgi:hypothetical protein